MYFTDVNRLKAKAKDEILSLESMVRRSWTTKYKLPATHPLWTDHPFSVHLQEFFEDKVLQKKELEEQLHGDLDPLQKTKLLEAIRAVSSLLKTDKERELEQGMMLSGRDPVMDALEVAEHLGEEIDLDITPEEAREYLKLKGY